MKCQKRSWRSFSRRLLEAVRVPVMALVMCGMKELESFSWILRAWRKAAENSSCCGLLAIVESDRLW
jgi:hypothetical protein